jgi:uncharacterized protein (TIGR03435 family)
MPDVTDMELVREYCARQSEPAFETLVHRHVNLVYSAALRQVGNPAQAEEITQAVFVILARKAARLRPDAVLAAWLHETARHLAASFLRGEIRRRRREQEAYMQSTLQPSSDESVWEQLAPLLDEAIGRLRTADRNVVALRYFQNKSAHEIAAALNIGEEAAKKRLLRAVEKLRLDFYKRGINVSTAALSGAVLTHSVEAAPAALAKTATAVALAKGAMASTSTLTLIKGALKIMAWTKATTTTVVGVGVLLAVGTATVHHLKARDAWRDPDVTPKMVQNTSSQVRILPTKFPGANELIRASDNFDKFVGINVTVADMVGLAYRDGNVPVPPQRIIFNTAEPRERYDFAATLPHGASAALQRELKTKLGFVARRETRDADAGILQLRVKWPNMPGLKQTTGKMGNINGTGGDGLSKIKCDNQPLSTVANVLGQIVNATVVDRTDLTGQYSFELTYNEIDGSDPHHDALKRALTDQLGLELAPEREPVEMLVVEPAQN